MKTTILYPEKSRMVLNHVLSQPLGDVTTAEVIIKAGDSNLTIDRLTDNLQELANGALQFDEKQGEPIQSYSKENGHAILTLNGGNAPKIRFHFPWSACNGATEWQIHLNPNVHYDISAHSDGGNIRLNLNGMLISRVMADTGGGNLDLVLPDHAANLSVTAKTGAGNVTVEFGSDLTGSNLISANSGAGNVVVCVPSGLAARIHATSGLGKALMDPRFIKADKDTYQSPDFDQAANKVEITMHSGAGNVNVITK